MRRVVIAVVMCAAQGVRADDNIAQKLAELQQQIDELRATADAAMSATASETDVAERKFRVYGFIDVGFQKIWSNDPAIDTPAASFVLGNVDLYFDFHPAPSWSSLVEVRLTNYPQGMMDTTVPDSANGLGEDTVRWGAIVLERAYIQWLPRDELGLRVGQFLTPYGIWNVDHGSPTLIALTRPDFISQELWPTHQIGIEAFGRLGDVLPRRWDLEYHAYVSNGRTVGLDYTDDKMFGGRLVASTRHIAFGLSVMHSATGEPQVAPTAPQGWNEDGVALDASLDCGPWRLRSEVVTRWLKLHGSGARGYDEDGYVLAAYRIRSTRLEPYGYIEITHDGATEDDVETRSSIGLNTYLTPAIQLKAQYTHTHENSAHEDLIATKLVMGL